MTSSPFSVYLSKWPESSDTHKTMREALNRVARALGSEDGVGFEWHLLRYEVVRGISAKLKNDGLAVATVNKMLSALRGVLETSWRMGLMPDGEYQKIEIKNLRGSSEPAGRALSKAEVELVFRALEDLKPRDAALVAVLCACGLRRVEAVRLLPKHYANGRLTAKGKGDKTRSIPVAKRWRPFIERWLKECESKERVFAVSRRTISNVVERFWKHAEVKRFTPHDFRRTFGTRVTEDSDIAVAKKLMGHENVQTTTLYDRRGEKAEEKAVKGL